ncbi:transglutaminase-like domain-containing protein [Lignipirellula cremea]|uniref:Transglutaminase-like superfamily protein n=1 Tax=Lignipirellula cremea TaxID=2528010 RepID=A0A518DV65_9BACT|nr:transglutaminase-like domain-containing protein [Lignipirellula cremea]QDU95728.1 Transglutaminase-like superfamily protein [Lignipirellula cremea]
MTRPILDRRSFLQAGIAAAATGAVCLPGDLPLSNRTGAADAPGERPHTGRLQQAKLVGPTSSIIPVVGDGDWIWTEPPEETGYQESRNFQLTVGISLTGGKGAASNIKATTPIPVAHPEQELYNAQIDNYFCAASTRQLTPEAAQLCVAAPQLLPGQKIGALARFQLRIRKDYRGFEKDQFPAAQEFPREFRKQYMYDSPGIQTRQAAVKEMADKIGGQFDHPWDKAKAFHNWVWTEITSRIGSYTSVIAALRDRVGDCEEKAATFAAFCRVSGIPARLVWVPNHNWAEFYLQDESGYGHWIPAHTSCYSWFGWTGAHELILQKGDSVPIPEKSKPERLMSDWMQWQGAKPEVQYIAKLEPIVESGDPGPGAREKDERGAWTPFGPYADKPFMRR